MKKRVKKAACISIQYDGEYPNLCSGELMVTIDGKEWKFPDHALSSGGSVHFGDDGEYTEDGEWRVRDWPEGFPDEMKAAVVREINKQIRWGCCGGCI